MGEYLEHCTPCWYGRHDECVPKIFRGSDKAIRCICDERGHQQPG